MQTSVYASERICDEKDRNYPMYKSWKALSVDELMKQCKAGEDAALEELIRRYKRMILYQAYRVTHNRDSADDVAGVACLSICRSIGTCKSARLLPAWIGSIVRNIWCDMHRRTLRRPVLSLDGLLTSKGNEFINMDEFLCVGANQGASPQKCAEEKERKSILDKAIARLPSGQRPLVTLFYWEGRTYGEIAEMLSLPVGTVKSRLNRARLALRDRLTPQRSYFLD